MLVSFIMFTVSPALALANDHKDEEPEVTGRGLTLAEDMVVSQALAATKAKVDVAKKAATKAKASATSTGDETAIAKADAVLVRLDGIQHQLDAIGRNMATGTDTNNLDGKITGVSNQLTTFGRQLDAIVELLEGLPTGDDVRWIVRQELADAKVVRVGCVDDGSLPYDPCPERLDLESEDEEESETTTVATVTSDSSLGWMVGAGGSTEYRGSYADIVHPWSVGGHIMAGLTWENGSVGTGIIGRGGIATVDSTMLGVTGVVYHNGARLDCGAGLGIEYQAYDVLGNGAPAANSVGGTISGYVRFGGAGSIVLEPYLRGGLFMDDGVDGIDSGVGLRLTVVYGK